MLALSALLLGSTLVASQADAKSCSSYAIITGYDADANTVDLKFGRGRVQKFFPRPEGTPADSTKVPKGCTGKVTRSKKLAVTPTGGRMSVTQVRSNFEGKMLNDTDDPAWLPNQLKQLIDSKTEIVIVVRPGMGKDKDLEITTLYLPITPEEEAEIARLEAQAEEL
jgi:hypothetical protein